MNSASKNKFAIKVKIDIKKDAWNWWHACNSHSFGMSWRKVINGQMQKKLLGVSKKSAYVYLIPHLNKLYKKLNIKTKTKPIQEIFNQKKDLIFQLMEKATGRKVFRNDFTLYLTTLARAPYNYPQGDVWLPIIWSEERYIDVFLHELLHFQTYAYWRKDCPKKMNNEEFENLKEALTVILDEDFKSIISRNDMGYKVHKYLRRDLTKHWQKNKNFDRLVKYGVKIYPEYKDTIKYLDFGQYVQSCPKQLIDKVRKVKTKNFSRQFAVKALELIKKEFDPKKHKVTKATNFAKSRFISSTDILKKRQSSCGSMATVVASVFRSLGIPVKLIDGMFVNDDPQMQHAWNEIYFPLLKRFIPFDITRKYFKIGKNHIRKGEYVDWSELEK